MKDGATTVRESGKMACRQATPSSLDTVDLDLDWDGIFQCANWGLGALRFHINTLRNMTYEIRGDDGERLHYLVELMEEQTDRIGSYLERLSEAMKKNNIKLEG